MALPSRSLFRAPDQDSQTSSGHLHWNVPQILQIHISKSTHPSPCTSPNLFTRLWTLAHHPPSWPRQTPGSHLNSPCLPRGLRHSCDSPRTRPRCCHLRPRPPHLTSSMITGALLPPRPQGTQCAHQSTVPQSCSSNSLSKPQSTQLEFSAKLSLTQPPSWIVMIAYLICLPNQR